VPTTERIPDLGPQQIMVCDRGFVYVGKATLYAGDLPSGGFWRLENARNIRVWGTSKGLGQLKDGPTQSTKLDDVGEIVIPAATVKGIIKCTRVW